VHKRDAKRIKVNKFIAKSEARIGRDEMNFAIQTIAEEKERRCAEKAERAQGRHPPPTQYIVVASPYGLTVASGKAA
jgi:hypothetical protein